MKRLTDNKIILVHRKTRLQELVARYNTVEQVSFYLKHLGMDIKDYVEEDTVYHTALNESSEILSALGRVQPLQREFLPNFIFGATDVVVALGQDGLVANTLKYLYGQPLIGVNPDPLRYDGILLPFYPQDLKRIVSEVFTGRRPISEISMAKATLQDGQELHAVNDLFVGQKSHVSARYILQLDNVLENHSSSGIIVSTGLGATGWLKSVVAGTTAILKAAGLETSILSEMHLPQRSDNFLQFTVREPFPSQNTQANLVFGSISREQPMYITSQMPQGGVIFSDGIESDFLEFCSGAKAVISLADKKGQLVV